MSRAASSTSEGSDTLAFRGLAGLLIVLWIAGGASRADVLGQPVVRFAAWALLIAFVLLGRRVVLAHIKTVAVLLGLSVALVALQLIPLPPSVWSTLPGRATLLSAADVLGSPQPWRPFSMSPGATVNALGSLIVPVAILLFASRLSSHQHDRVLTLLLVLVVAGGVLGLVQATGTRVPNPLINDIRGMVGANFANRNHFALFLAVGCLLTPVWGLHRIDGAGWRSIAALALLLFLILMILATGSRAGLVLGAVGTVAGLLTPFRALRHELSRVSRVRAMLLIGGVVTTIVVAVTVSILLDRAVSVDRVLTMDVGEDLRTRALPVVLDLVRGYMPMGTGFGTFDPVYRIAEPDSLLQPSYFNHAHNDWLELALDGGLPAILLLAGGLVWWVAASVRVWRPGRPRSERARAGSIIILLVLLASVADYPARTPMIMAVLVLGAVWLASGASAGSVGRR